MCNENGKWSIEDYVNGDCSICREERQYALYLSNVLRYYGKHYQKLKEDVKAQNIFESIFFKKDMRDITVENVFYEATFMRDIFERNRRYYLTEEKNCDKLKKVYAQKSFKPKRYRVDKKEDSFNYKLIKFCRGNEPVYNDKIEEINYGHNAPEDYKNIKHKMQAMMNAKPDLAIVYRENDNRYLLFIECKFDSYESEYYSNGNDNEDKMILYQREAQGLIAEFLCNKNKDSCLPDDSYLSDLNVSKLMKNDTKKYKTQYISRLVQFVRGGECSEVVETDNGKIIKINITELIKLERKIFE